MPACKLDGEIEVAGQFGDIRASTAAAAPVLDVQAWTSHAELGFTYAAAWRPRVAVLADLATGDDAATPGYERFDPLYGPRRGDWNPTGTYGPFGRSNIRSVRMELGGAVLMKGRFFDAFPTVPQGDTTFGYSALNISF